MRFVGDFGQRDRGDEEFGGGSGWGPRGGGQDQGFRDSWQRKRHRKMEIGRKGKIEDKTVTMDF